MKRIEDTFLYREIHEQPEVLGRLLEAEQVSARELAAEIRRRELGQVVIAARGTSDNAARYAKYVLGAANGLLVGLATPSLFTIYQQPPRFGNALVLGISQSGKSPDIVSVVAEGELRTQPGKFTLSGEGLVVGRDSADAVSKEYKPPFEFIGGARQHDDRARSAQQPGDGRGTGGQIRGKNTFRARASGSTSNFALILNGG